ncbi:MAG TPA: serine/threonine-protein kinase [Micromonosporaceae bacterium]|nr:serine/threonine-protein kinase [Micromonosporaceae bacterium]
MSERAVIAGRYELLTELGQGGFGAVWRAYDRTLGRDVAVKLVSFGSLADAEAAMARFRQEARAVAGFNHPNIVTAHDFGEHDGSAYLVMELVTGGSLADEQAQARSTGDGSLPVARVRTLADQICAGLGAAHAAGLVHRDLKPANIMLSGNTGAVKIVDFGIVWVDRESRLTRDGDHLGTLRYAAPEQLDIGVVDGRADLYALACVLYELLSARSPYRANTPADWIAAHLKAEPIPLRLVRPDVPDGLAVLIHRMLAKDPAHRPAGADEVRAALAAPDEVPIIGRAQFGRVGAAVSAPVVSMPSSDSPSSTTPSGGTRITTRPYSVGLGSPVSGNGGIGAPTQPPTMFDARGLPPYPRIQQPTNGIATAGLVCGILPLPPFGFAFGLIGFLRARRLGGVGRVRGALGVIFALLWSVPVIGGIGAGLEHLSRRLDPACISVGVYTHQFEARIRGDGTDVHAIVVELTTAAAELRADAAKSNHPNTAADLTAFANDLDAWRAAVASGHVPSKALSQRLAAYPEKIRQDCT